MRIMEATLIGTHPYSQSRRYDNVVQKLNKETAEQYDLRTWREHCTVDHDGNVCIPAMSVKMAIDTAAKKLGEKIPGKRGLQWGGIVMSGVVPSEPHFNIVVPAEDKRKKGNLLHKDNVKFEDLWCDAQGRRNGKTRVMRRFPIVHPPWQARVSFMITDDSILEELLERYLIEAGQIVGIGRFRPENGGWNGRFVIEDVVWSSPSLEAAQAAE